MPRPRNSSSFNCNRCWIAAEPDDPAWTDGSFVLRYGGWQDRWRARTRHRPGTRTLFHFVEELGLVGEDRGSLIGCLGREIDARLLCPIDHLRIPERLSQRSGQSRLDRARQTGRRRDEPLQSNARELGLLQRRGVIGALDRCHGARRSRGCADRRLRAGAQQRQRGDDRVAIASDRGERIFARAFIAGDDLRLDAEQARRRSGSRHRRCRPRRSR